MFKFLATYYRNGFRRYFHHNTLAKSLTLAAFLFVIGGFSVIVHEGFYYGFKYILRDAFFGEAISIYIIELFLLVSSFLMFTSALVSGVVALYRDGGEGAVMASPSYALKPRLVLLRMFASSLWPLMVVIVPALLAIMRVFPLTISGFVLALLASVILVFVAVQAAMLVIFCTAALLMALRAFSRFSLLLSTFAIFLSLTFAIGEQFRSVDLVSFFQARLLSKNLPDLSPILEQFQVFPSHLVTMIVYYSENGMFSSALLLLFGIFALAAFLLTIFLFTTKSHLSYWQIAQEHSGKASRTRVFFRFDNLLAKADRPEGALFVKEFILFVRNIRGMLWLCFILVIWGIQTAASMYMTYGLGTERVSGAELPSAAMAFQFALITYFVSMFALRFAFPSFSEEKKFGWVVGSSPLLSTSAFRSKLYFFSTLFSLLAILFTMLNASIVGLASAMMPFLLLLVCISVVTITTYALSLGALFPNTETDDPEVLSTTLPGLMFIIVAVFYGGAGALVFRSYLAEGRLLWVVAFVFFSIATVSSLLVITQKYLRKNSQRYSAL